MQRVKRAISGFAFVVFYKDFQYFIHSFKSDSVFEKTKFSANNYGVALV